MKIVVVGGNGLIGRALICALKERGNCEILSIDKDEHSIDGCNCKQVDILNYKALVEGLVSADVVYHKASVLGGAKFSTDCTYAEVFFDANIMGTSNVIEASIANGVKKLVFDSSVAVYGEQSQSRLASENIFPKARNFYGFSKVIAERLLYKSSKESSLNVNILRYSRVRTPDSEDVVYHFIKSINQGNPVKIYGNPRKQIEFVDIRDVVKANIITLDLDVKWGTFNITSGEKVSLVELVKLCALYLGGKDFDIEFNDNILNAEIEPLITEMSTANARNILGFVPSYDLSMMLSSTIRGMRSV